MNDSKPSAGGRSKNRLHTLETLSKVRQRFTAASYALGVAEERRAPAHLAPATRTWWERIATEYALEAPHWALLTAAGEAWDRCQAARAVIAREGLTFTDFRGQPKARPEIAIERDSRLAFARVIRELGLDTSDPDSARPPRFGRRAS